VKANPQEQNNGFPSLQKEISCKDCSYKQ